MAKRSGHEPEPGQVRERRAKYGEQDEYGNSVANLRLNLKLTPIERIRKAEQAAKSALELRRALRPTD